MTFQIRSTKSINASDGIKALIYGLSGTGKTRLLASAPYPFIISAERGLLSLRRSDIPFIEVRSFADLINAFYFVQQNATARQFPTIALDSISDIAEACLLDAQSRNAKDPRRAYLEMQEKVQQAFKWFRDIPNRNIVMIAKQSYEQDQFGVRQNMPMFPGQQLKQSAPYIFDLVGQMNRFVDPKTNRIFYLLRCQRDMQNDAKDRSGNLAEWENADPATGGGLTAIFNKMVT